MSLRYDLFWCGYQIDINAPEKKQMTPAVAPCARKEGLLFYRSHNLNVYVNDFTPKESGGATDWLGRPIGRASML